VITVILLYPNNRRQEVMLAGVPREGERIALDNNGSAPTLVVDQVTWLEGEGRAPDPEVVISVHVADR
jgi:hypothetical protein